MEKKHPVLKKIKKALSNRYSLDWDDGSVLHIQLEHEGPVVGFFLVDPESDKVVFSVALDFPDVFLTADICLEAAGICHIELGEGFYITEDERLLWGKEAVEQMRFEDVSEMRAPAGTVMN